MDDVVRVAEALRAGADVAIASRTHPDSRLLIAPALQGYAYRRHLQSQLFSKLVRFILPIGQTDTQAGLKGMSQHIAERIVPRLACDGFAFDCELLTACARLGVTVTEVPVRARYEHAHSTTTLASTGQMVRALWRIRRRWQSAECLGESISPPTTSRRAA
jgi:hypothetical protein